MANTITHAATSSSPPAPVRPIVPPIKNIEAMDRYTSDTVWESARTSRKKRLLILGGGPIGCELSQAFARLGVAVTQVEMLPKLLLREDEEVSKLVRDKFVDEGIEVLTGHRAQHFFRRDGRNYLVAQGRFGQRRGRVRLLCRRGRTRAQYRRLRP